MANAKLQIANEEAADAITGRKSRLLRHASCSPRVGGERHRP